MRPEPSKAESRDESLHFDVDAALLLELGEKLVARRSLALAELVKNAYDADATEVIVEFDNVSQPGGSIVVSDDGTGMTIDSLKQGWMRIATTNKVRDPYSTKFRRVRTGAKGVGRFAARLLSKRLHLVSTAENAGRVETIEATFEWDQFRSGMDLSRIPVRVKRSVRTGVERTGTTLTLLDLRSSWTKKEVEDTSKHLYSLTSPFVGSLGRDRERSGDPDFRILVICPEYPDIEGELADTFLSAASYKLSGLVLPDGSVRYSLVTRGVDGEEVFVPGGVSYSDLAGASFVVHFFVYRRDYFSGTVIDFQDAKEKGRTEGGVRVYLDGFRVFPYGEPGDDWLDLDEDRARRTHGIRDVLSDAAKGTLRPMLLLPGNNQLFGAVYVSRTKHQDIIPTMSREGLQHTPSFRNLKDFVRLGIDWMTIQHARRVQMQKAKSDAELKGRRSAVRLLEEALELVEEPGFRNEAVMKDKIAEALSAARAERHEHISELSMLRVLASAGTATVIFLHQIRGIIDGLAGTISDITRLRADVSEEVLTRLDPLIKDLDEWRKAVEEQAHLIGVLISPGARKRRRRLVVRPIVDRVVGFLADYMRRYGIEFANEVDPVVRTPPMFEAELHSIILSLLTNAIKAVMQQPTRRISVSAWEDDTELRLQMLDSGCGIDPKDRERVFEPFVTTSIPDPVLGVGTGLGLTIVRDIVRQHSGTIRFVDPPAGWSTCVDITVPCGVDEA